MGTFLFGSQCTLLVVAWLWLVGQFAAAASDCTITIKSALTTTAYNVTGDTWNKTTCEEPTWDYMKNAGPWFALNIDPLSNQTEAGILQAQNNDVDCMAKKLLYQKPTAAADLKFDKYCELSDLVLSTTGIGPHAKIDAECTTDKLNATLFEKIFESHPLSSLFGTLYCNESKKFHFDTAMGEALNAKHVDKCYVTSGSGHLSKFRDDLQTSLNSINGTTMPNVSTSEEAQAVCNLLRGAGCRLAIIQARVGIKQCPEAWNKFIKWSLTGLLTGKNMLSVVEQCNLTLPDSADFVVESVQSPKQGRSRARSVGMGFVSFINTIQRNEGNFTRVNYTKDDGPVILIGTTNMQIEAEFDVHNDMAYASKVVVRGFMKQGGDSKTVTLDQSTVTSYKDSILGGKKHKKLGEMNVNLIAVKKVPHLLTIADPKNHLICMVFGTISPDTPVVYNVVCSAGEDILTDKSCSSYGAFVSGVSKVADFKKKKTGGRTKREIVAFMRTKRETAEEIQQEYSDNALVTKSSKQYQTFEKSANNTYNTAADSGSFEDLNDPVKAVEMAEKAVDQATDGGVMIQQQILLLAVSLLATLRSIAL